MGLQYPLNRKLQKQERTLRLRKQQINIIHILAGNYNNVNNSQIKSNVQ